MKVEKEKETPCEEITEKEIDQALVGSFPASDPPPWSLGVEDKCGDEPDESEEAQKRESGEQ